MERCDLAVERKHELGCNCCQAVLFAFEKEIAQRWCGDACVEDALMALGSGFGSGMGGMEATCGALVGAGMVVGLLNGSGISADKGSEADCCSGAEAVKPAVPTVLKTRRLCAEFKEMVGALRCADIKGVQTHRPLCSCDNCVRYAIQIAEKYI